MSEKKDEWMTLGRKETEQMVISEIETGKERAENVVDEKKIYQEIRNRVLNQLDLSRELSDEEVQEIIGQVIFSYTSEHFLPSRMRNQIGRDLFNSLRKLDILQSLVEDHEITEIMINGPNHIFIEKKGRITQLEKQFESKEKLEDVVQQISSAANRMVNEASPILDVRLFDGSRVNIVLPPVALEGPIVTIRKFPDTPISMARLLELGSLTEAAAQVLEQMVISKYNIFISGGTGSGKTTFLNALSQFIPEDERLITIEDSAELQIQGVPNLVRLESRNANMEGENEISIRDLIKSSLRMRPDRLVVGEVRDAAAIDMLQAMNTGHDGSLSTGHANSPADMLGRLETMVLLGMEIPLLAVRRQISSALELIIHLGRLRDRSRRVLSIVEVLDCVDGEIRVNPIYEFKEEGQNRQGRVIGRLVRTKNPFVQTQKLARAGIRGLINEGL